MVVHADGVALLLLFLLCSVPVGPILRTAVLHHHDTPPPCWGQQSPTVSCASGVPPAQAAAAAVNAVVDAPLLRATVVVANALRGGAAELVELLKILGQGSICQVGGRCVAQGAQLVVRRFLHPWMEEDGVKVLSETRRRDG